MFIKLNKTTFYVDFKKRIYSYTNYAHGVGYLKLNKNQFAYNTIT